MPIIYLRAMTAAEFDELRSTTILDYAAEHVRAGLLAAEEAALVAKSHVDYLLPDGLHTSGMCLRSGELFDHSVVGYVWLSVPESASPTKSSWLYGIEVLPHHRRKGYGRALLAAAEDEAARHGATSLGLNVFAGNAVARHLYDSAGYQLSAQQMRKSLRVQ